MSWPVEAGSRPRLGGFLFESRAVAEAYLFTLLVVMARDGWIVSNVRIVSCGGGANIVASIWRPFGLLEAR